MRVNTLNVGEEKSSSDNEQGERGELPPEGLDLRRSGASKQHNVGYGAQDSSEPRHGILLAVAAALTLIIGGGLFALTQESSPDIVIVDDAATNGQTPTDGGEIGGESTETTLGDVVDEPTNTTITSVNDGSTTTDGSGVSDGSVTTGDSVGADSISEVSEDTGPSSSPTPGVVEGPDLYDMAEGSGCRPSTDGALPDGQWYGTIVDGQPDQITFDLQCLFLNAVAEAAAAQDGDEVPTPTGLHIRNDNPKLRTMPVEGDVQFTWISEASPVYGTYGEWQSSSFTRPELGTFVELTIIDGEVFEIQEQYLS